MAKSVTKNYLVRFGGAGAVFPRLFVGRRNCTRLPLTTGPPNVDKLRSTCVIASKKYFVFVKYMYTGNLNYKIIYHLTPKRYP